MIVINIVWNVDSYCIGTFACPHYTQVGLIVYAGYNSGGGYKRPYTALPSTRCSTYCMHLQGIFKYINRSSLTIRVFLEPRFYFLMNHCFQLILKKNWSNVNIRLSSAANCCRKCHSPAQRWVQPPVRRQITLACKKNSQEFFFQFSVNFPPAEYEYESHFFPIPSRFSEKLRQKFKNQQNRLFTGCVYAEVNQQKHCFAYVKCFSGNVIHLYVQIQTLDPFHPPKKKKQNYNYNTGLNFLTFFRVPGK